MTYQPIAAANVSEKTLPEVLAVDYAFISVFHEV
jgi:hypothetical protein